MTDLNSLTVPNLEKLAKECGITLKKSAKKADKIEAIRKANIDDQKLTELINKYRKKKEIKKTPNQNLEARVEVLERELFKLKEQVNHLISETYYTEKVINTEQIEEVIDTDNDLLVIKSLIKSFVLPGASISIDELIKIEKLQKFPLTLLEQAIEVLISEQTFAVSEGDSTRKIKGKIGVLKRKM
ncbi:MAG: hypothetical protein ACFFDN_39720 [Candidatus Hodarchaeota archaeon]